MQDPNEVAQGLNEIAALLSFDGAPRFKLKAYETAAEIVKTVGEELGPLVEQNRLRELQGIGSALSQQIQELWNTGSSELLNRLRAAHPEGAAELVQIEGMTPKRIVALHAALGIRSIDDLRAACLAGRVQKVAGFGAKTEERLLASCERFLNRKEGPPPRVVLSDALAIAEKFERELRHDFAEVHVAGALRRGEETLNELDLFVSGDRERAWERLSSLRQVLRVDRSLGVAHLSGGLLLRLHAAERDLGNAWLAATANAAHWEMLEARARERGFALSPAAGLGHRGFASEDELYRALDLPYIPPELRVGTNEIQRAERGEFAELVELGDVQGMVHCHTTYSDGRDSIEAMARAAHELGMKYITITDHSPSAHYARGVSVERLKEQWDEIAAAEERVPIRILRGTESDILSDG
ncbi:MAG TPA: helix-hairpin-helix domain-containing protein, partial [Polyangiaceae bacterium]|nr:helix-hairpin-helix domain-containing protein [Polyangiaceae bacterium]